MDEAALNLLFLVVILGGFFLLVVRPQRRRLREVQQVQQSLAVGSRVLTSAGLHATVVEVAEADVLLEVAPGVRCRYARGAVVRLLTAP